MAEAGKRSRRIDWLMLALGTAVWVFNTYNMVTGLRTMKLLDGLSGGMCFFVGPFLLFEYFKAARGGEG